MQNIYPNVILYLLVLVLWIQLDSTLSTSFWQTSKFYKPFSIYNKNRPSSLETSVIPKGLKNLRNTCYMNSILQSLHKTKSFSDGVNSTNFNSGTPGSELKELFKAMKLCSETTTRPLAKSMEVNVAIQEDAEEFLLKLLSSVDDSIVELKKDLWLSKHFTSEILQTIACVNVNYTKTNTQKYIDLSLDIDTSASDSKYTDTVLSALDRYFSPELLTGENQYRAGATHGLQDALKSVAINSLPETLVIHLKRFAYRAETGEMEKIHTPVVVPRSLDMRPYQRPNNTFFIDPVTDMYDPQYIPSYYDLSSVVVHQGRSLDSGHYFTLLRPEPLRAPEMWYKMDDNVVTALTSEQALCIASGAFCGQEDSRGAQSDAADKEGVCSGNKYASGYLLFYTRRNTTTTSSW